MKKIVFTSVVILAMASPALASVTVGSDNANEVNICSTSGALLLFTDPATVYNADGTFVSYSSGGNTCNSTPLQVGALQSGASYLAMEIPAPFDDTVQPCWDTNKYVDCSSLQISVAHFSLDTDGNIVQFSPPGSGNGAAAAMIAIGLGGGAFSLLARGARKLK